MALFLSSTEQKKMPIPVFYNLQVRAARCAPVVDGVVYSVNGGPVDIFSHYE